MSHLRRCQIDDEFRELRKKDYRVSNSMSVNGLCCGLHTRLPLGRIGLCYELGAINIKKERRTKWDCFTFAKYTRTAELLLDLCHTIFQSSRYAFGSGFAKAGIANIMENRCQETVFIDFMYILEQSTIEIGIIQSTSTMKGMTVFE